MGRGKKKKKRQDASSYIAYVRVRALVLQRFLFFRTPWSIMARTHIISTREREEILIPGFHGGRTRKDER